MATAVEIPAGMVHRRTFGGVPLGIAAVLGVLPILAALLYSYLLGGVLILPCTLCWLFAAYRTKQDPDWFGIWLEHLTLKEYYTP